MPHDLTLLDRLRIERVVWTLDQQLYDLPSSSRVAKRREVRSNLRAAAGDVGAAAAVRRIGGGSRLASEYVDAELGEGPRHSWVAAGAVAFLVPLVLNALLSEATNAYVAGVLARDPSASGTFSWGGVAFLQSSLTFTFTDGHQSHTGGTWSAITWVVWVAATVWAGRLWRHRTVRRAPR